MEALSSADHDADDADEEEVHSWRLFFVEVNIIYCKSTAKMIEYHLVALQTLCRHFRPLISPALNIINLLVVSMDVYYHYPL